MATRNERVPEEILPRVASPTQRLAREIASATGKDDTVKVMGVLQRDIERSRDLASAQLMTTLEQFAKDDALQLDANVDELPIQLFGLLRQPDGSQAANTIVLLDHAVINAAKIAPVESQRTKTLLDGTFVLRLPDEWRRRKPTSIVITVSGENGSTVVVFPIAQLSRDGNTGPVTLPRNVSPAPLALLAGLERIGIDADIKDPLGPPGAARKELTLGEGDCNLVFRTDPSQDKFPYGVMFRLTDPQMSSPTLAGARSRRDGEQTERPLRAIFPDELVSGLPEGTELHAAQRVTIDRAISVPAFRRTLTGADTPRNLPIAATLAVGYVVHFAQRWSQVGLALGDLVYSLPLAPGEQQRIAMVERTQTSSVMEREALEQREDLRFDEVDTSSAQATFSAAFSESAQGGSSFDASSSSFSVAAAAGGGGVFPFGAFAGGVATSYGSASSAGSSNSWMSGARNSASNAAQNTQAAVSRRATASRSSARTGIRLASASESTNITTKVITNHNKTRALTMQYWEVLRLFDVQTVVEDVSLVCMVPLDIVDFLPEFEPELLDSSQLDRVALLRRYRQLIAHSDVLAKTVPWRLRRGLQALNDFSADPRATVQAPTGNALRIVNINVLGAFSVQDTLRAELLLKNGMRTGSAPLSGNVVSLPSGANAVATETELFNILRNQRASFESWSGSIALPLSVALQDIVGVVLSRSTKRLDYTFAPEGLSAAQQLAAANVGAFATLLSTIVTKPIVSRSYDGNRVNSELGDLLVKRVDANIDGIIVAVQDFNSGAALPSSGLTISANRFPPELSYDSLLDIERTLQWVMRNTMLCSTRVAQSLSAEERAVMLERYSVTPPIVRKDGSVQEGISLLSCVTNNVLGFYGNSIVMPFHIPLELAQDRKLDTAKLQRSLKRFHTESFDRPRSTIALPTKGVLGEAVLGSCSSAEKIDLTRFWNWQDSPGDEATQISPISLPGNSLLGSEAPSKLAGLSPIINNFSTQGPLAADTSLATAIAGRAIELSKPFEIDKLTNAGGLATVIGKTADNAESARKDALQSATQLAAKAMDAAVAIDAKNNPGPKPKEPDKTEAPKPDPVPVPVPQPPPGVVTPPAPTRPSVLKVFFNLDKTDIVDSTNEGRAGQNARIAAFVAAAKAFKATAILVRGYASPEGSASHNAKLVKDRADVVAAKLRADLPGVSITTAVGGTVSGPPSSEFPELRRGDAEITGP
jgi:outer membrane protein OmpA-like peptidoglycan-associated protein